MTRKRGKQHLKRRARERVERQIVNFYDVALTIDDERSGHTLRQRAYEVDFHGEDPSPAQIFEVCGRLLWITKHDSNCLGIAAPQVGIGLRIFTMKDNDGVPWCFVNPTVEPREGALKQTEYEGCYSVPNRRVHVTRWTSVTVKGFTAVGEPLERTFTGRAARIVQHEMDHLEGICIDAYGELEPMRGDVISTGETVEEGITPDEVERRVRAGA